MTSITSSKPAQFRFYQPVQVRYADLDTLRHVNNVKVLEYVETARTGYYKASGIWDGAIRDGFGMVVASVHIDYVKSIQYGDTIRVGIMVRALGSKSLRFWFQVESSEGERVFAKGEVVMVAYDFETRRSRAVPKDWREKLAAFEQNEELLA
ncbi:MAG: acyl-CoA thioesterase [Chloroflexi bacterium]|nr:acyl-CoA thioesterase [Chloroflexota bacterium]